MRIASLLPSATEIVCALGAREELVGISHECDHPAGLGLPHLTRTRRALPRACAAIDRSIREMVNDGLSVYEIEVERLRELAPDVIITQDLCEVCAVSLNDLRSALREWVDEKVEVISLQPLRLADVWSDLRRVGQALGRQREAEAVVARCEARCASISERSLEAVLRPTVLTLEWLDPVMIGGTWMPELVALAGGRPLVTRPGQHAPTLDRDHLAELDPDVVIVKPCGFKLERSLEELELLRSELPWDCWRAARSGRVFLADGNAFFNRPGPRLVESLEIVAACLHPELFAAEVGRHASSVRRVGHDLEVSSFDL